MRRSVPCREAGLRHPTHANAHSHALTSITMQPIVSHSHRHERTQVGLTDGKADIQITLICTSRTVAATRRALRQAVTALVRMSWPVHAGTGPASIRRWRPSVCHGPGWGRTASSRCISSSGWSLPRLRGNHGDRHRAETGDQHAGIALTVDGGLASVSVRAPGYCGRVIPVGRVQYGLGLRRLRPACRPFGCGRDWRG
jgi:hypothetical protein